MSKVYEQIAGLNMLVQTVMVISRDPGAAALFMVWEVYSYGRLSTQGSWGKRGWDCGKIEEEEPSSALGGVWLVTFPLVVATGRI